MKGQIAVLESILMIIVLFVSLSVFLGPQSYKNNWQIANVLTSSRDIILTLDRLGLLYTYSANPALMNNFLNTVITQKNIIFGYTTDGAIKSTVIVDCNCTDSQLTTLKSWTQNLQVNGRSIQVVACQTFLDSLNPCLGKQPDVLLIWGYKDLTPYTQTITNFLKSGSGIVEIMDLSNLDSVQQSVFGIGSCSSLVPSCGWANDRQDSFLQPSSALSPSYQAYKYFYHAPLNLPAPTSQASMPSDGPSCSSTSIPMGNFTFQSSVYDFWICNTNTVYFDTNGNGKADMQVNLQQSFKLNGYNFLLNYINTNSIGVSFKPTFSFTDFLKSGSTQVYPIDKDVNKILLNMGNYSNSQYPIPVVITNGTVARTAWVADFTRNLPGDEYRQLLLTLLMSVSNKKTASLTFTQLKFGYFTSYVNVVNKDMYEVSDFNLALGFPQ